MKKAIHDFSIEQWELLPTQSVVGNLEVMHKVNLIHSMSKRELKRYIATHPVPLIIGPGNVPYLIDHHHFLRAIYQTGATNVIKTKLLLNLHYMKKPAFWRLMVKNNWVYLNDENGNPIPPKKLPKSIWHLKNDPYRSLAWLVREYGGFKKVDHIPFFEFQWANFFRKKIKISHKDHQMHNALKRALKLAKSPKAKHLPGYKGKR